MIRLIPAATGYVHALHVYPAAATQLNFYKLRNTQSIRIMPQSHISSMVRPCPTGTRSEYCGAEEEL